MMEALFWTSIVLLAYPYLFYPAALLVAGMVAPRPVRRAQHEPAVTVLIPAYNEAEVIGATLDHMLASRYRADRLEIIVVSDGSTDGTDDIVRRHSARGVRLLRCESREGKAAALNAAVREAHGEIIVFSDANSLFEPDAIARLVENFADPDVGYVTGALAFSADATVSGAGSSAYIRYENLLRRLETRVGSIIGVNGGIDAVRRELYADVPRSLITDFVLPLSVIAGGRRVVFEPGARSHESPNSQLASEFRMRVRVALRAFQGVAYMRRLFNPVRYPLAAFCLVSHKLVRYAGFVFLAGALVANIALAPQSLFYAALLGLQLVAYALGLVGAWRQPKLLRRLIVVPTYVCMTYAAFAVAAVKFVRGESMATWRPRAG